MAGYRVAILGATGLVGREFLKVLAQRKFPVAELRLLASERSAGTRLEFAGELLPVEEASPAAFRGIDYALFSAGTEASRELAPAAVASGAVVIDNSAAWRMEPEVPLVVPEVNPADAFAHRGIIANPNCSTIQLVVALHPLHRVNPLRRVVVATYQSVSGTGAAALDELYAQTRALLAGEPIQPAVYPHQIAFNVLPHIDVFLDNGYTKEEWKMVQETRKIMHAPDLAVSATTVRVPVPVGHAEAVQAEFTRPMAPAEARALLERAPGVVVLDDPAAAVYPLPSLAAGRDEVFVGRIRADASHPCGLALWVVADNLRKGAALNAVQIAELLLRGPQPTAAATAATV
ncbi:MAG TPA: aspartate-semialdehyde dehydrogenase [Chloroflexota bacterium]|nr:aspartate-semialdehyde dehydrogenase [Chloroflexota bacterium]